MFKEFHCISCKAYKKGCACEEYKYGYFMKIEKYEGIYDNIDIVNSFLSSLSKGRIEKKNDKMVVYIPKNSKIPYLCNILFDYYIAIFTGMDGCCIFNDNRFNPIYCQCNGDKNE